MNQERLQDELITVGAKVRRSTYDALTNLAQTRNSNRNRLLKEAIDNILLENSSEKSKALV